MDTTHRSRHKHAYTESTLLWVLGVLSRVPDPYVLLATGETLNGNDWELPSSWATGLAPPLVVLSYACLAFTVRLTRSCGLL